MNTTTELREHASSFCIALRQGDGFRRADFDRLRETITRFCAEHAEADFVPKEAARVLIDLIPIVDSAANLYAGDQAAEIREASAMLFDLLLHEF